MTLISLVVVNLLSLGLVTPGPGLPPGWKTRFVRGVGPPAVEIIADGSDQFLRLNSAGRAAWFYRPVASLPAGGRLRWSWRVVTAPAGASLAVKALDDSPLRVFVVFGKLGGLLNRSSRVIFYSVAGADPIGYAAASHLSKRLHVIGLDGVGDVGSWREHEADPVADFLRIWGREPSDPITAVGVMQDTDQTGSRAVADLRKLEWEAGQ